jgi:hypothetical protein
VAKTVKSERQAKLDKIRKQQRGAESRRSFAIIGTCALIAVVIVAAWVLATTARDGGRLKGFAFSTLERIGGTPSVIVGLASVRRTSKRDTVLRALVTELLRRAVLAFPDEDVVIGTRLNSASGFEAYKSLPRPDHRASGEERAWGRRFVKRFGLSSLNYDEHAFRSKGTGEQACVFDHCSLKPESISTEVNGLFKGLDADRGDVVVACGWALAEDLEKLL